MALKPLQAGIQPLGQFDGYDADTTLGGIKGGEVATLINYAFYGTYAGTDKAAADADGSDGYVGAAITAHYRPIVTRNVPSGARPLFLTDEGTTGYGTLFGEVIGGTAGKKTTGTNQGPHTAEGSGKVTIWDKPGLYAVTLDAVDTTASTGLVVGNTSLDVGDALYGYAITGVLTPNSGAAFENVVVARFVEFSTNGSLVTTPNYLVTTDQQVAFTQAVIHFDVET